MGLNNYFFFFFLNLFFFFFLLILVFFPFLFLFSSVLEDLLEDDLEPLIVHSVFLVHFSFLFLP